MKLLPEAEEDVVASLGIEFGDPHIYTKKLKEKRKSITTESIFASKPAIGPRDNALQRSKAAGHPKQPSRLKAQDRSRMKTF